MNYKKERFMSNTTSPTNAEIRKILSLILANKNIDHLLKDRLYRNAMHECVEQKFVQNVTEMQTTLGDYQFSIFENMYVTPDGRSFLSDTSKAKGFFRTVLNSADKLFWIAVGAICSALVNILLSIFSQ